MNIPKDILDVFKKYGDASIEDKNYWLEEIKKDFLKPKEEKIEVFQFSPYTNNPNSTGQSYYACGVSNPIPPEKYQDIKKAIEFVLQYNEHPLKDSIGNNLYTEKEVLEKEEAAFIAGRHSYVIRTGYDSGSPQFKYNDFNDFKNSTK